MRGDTLRIVMGVDMQSITRLRDELGRWMRMQDTAQRYTETQLGLAATLFTSALREEFSHGTDKYGRSHNKTGAALRSMRVQVHGLVAEVEMGGGAVYVEYGWTRPEMRAKPGGVFAFVDGDGQRVFTKTVRATRYAGDDFVGRAMLRCDLRVCLERIAYGTFSTMTGHAVSAGGFLYGGGRDFKPLGPLLPLRDR